MTKKNEEARLHPIQSLDGLKKLWAIGVETGRILAQVLEPDKFPYAYAESIAGHLHYKYFRNDQGDSWKPEPSLRGVLGQIDNMLYGIEKRIDAAEKPEAAMLVNWEGGDAAPADWDGGPVLRRHGGFSMPSGPFAWKSNGGGQGNIVGYKSSEPEIRAALENGRRFLAACYSAWASGEATFPATKFVPIAEDFKDALEALDNLRSETTISRPTEPLDGCEFCLGAKGGIPGNENTLHGSKICDQCSSLIDNPSPEDNFTVKQWRNAGERLSEAMEHGECTASELVRVVVDALGLPRISPELILRDMLDKQS